MADFNNIDEFYKGFINLDDSEAMWSIRLQILREWSVRKRIKLIGTRAEDAD